MLIQYIRYLFPIFPYLTRCGIVLTYCTLTGWLLHRVAKRTAAGSLERTLTCIPVILGNLLAPSLFSPVDDLLTYCLLCFVVLWLASFKVRCDTSRLRAVRGVSLLPSNFREVSFAKSPVLPGGGPVHQQRQLMPEHGFHPVLGSAMDADHAPAHHAE